MRYTIVNGDIEAVRRIEVDGNIITNPTDEQVDAAGAGYPLSDNFPAPVEVDFEMQKLVAGYALVDGVIISTETAVDRTTAEQIAHIDERIAALNVEFAEYKDTPIIIDGKGYLPRWVYEYYNSMLLLGTAAFPMSVAAVDGTAIEMTYEQFLTLYQTLVTTVATYTSEVNAYLANLNAAKAALTGGENGV